MTDGYWIAMDGKELGIHDHEAAIRRPEVAQRFNVPVRIFKQMGRFKTGEDRDQFLPWVMRRVPIIRARGRGVVCDLQWGRGTDKQAFRAIHKWGKKVGCGDFLMLSMSNLRTGKQYNCYWMLFDEAMKKGKRIKPAPLEVSGQ